MLSIFVSQELEKTSETTYFFCSAEDEKRNTAIAVIRGLLWQLTGLYPQLTKMLRERLGALSDSAFSSRETLWNEFKRLLDTIQSDRCYCIIDGLDECDESSQQWLAKKLVAFGTDDLTKSFKVLVVSRDLIHLRHSRQIKLDSDHSESVDRAVKTFIDVRTEALFHQISFNDKLQNEIRNKLFKDAQGSFLWIGFVMIDMLKQKTQTGVLNTLQELPAGLVPLYNRMLQNIDASQRTTCLSILCCVATVLRPLDLDELVAMIKSWPQLELSIGKESVEDVITDCGPLFQVTKHTVKLVHESVRDYTKHGVFPDGLRISTEETHLRIARACIDALTQGAHTRSILVSYAENFWPQHARDSGKLAKELICHSSSFFGTNSTSRAIWWQSYLTTQPQVVFKYGNLTPLNLACLLGIEPWANDILSNLCTRSLVVFSVEFLVRILMFWIPVRVQDAQAMTALHFSAIGGREGIAKLLLDHGAAIDAGNWDGQTALHLAAAGGQEASARLLLDRNANIRAEDWEGFTALHLASMAGHGAMVELLLESGADIEHRNQDGATPLHWAAWIGNEATVELLLKSGADLNATTSKSLGYRTALHLAAGGGARTVRVVSILLDRGADINATDSTGSTALHLAAASWNQTLKMLRTLEATTVQSSNISVEFPGVMGPSIDARLKRSKAAVKLTGATTEFNLRISSGITLIIHLLVEHQANVGIRDKWGETAFAKVTRGVTFVKERTQRNDIRSGTRSKMIFRIRENTELWLMESPIVLDLLEQGASWFSNLIE